MIYEVSNTEIVKPLFEGWNETLIYSCLQKVMGKIYVTNIENPKSAMAWVGAFSFYVGVPCEELIRYMPDNFMIMVPKNEAWATLIETCYPNNSKRRTRYAIKKNTVFDPTVLEGYVNELPKEYTLKLIDETLYDKCLETPWSREFVSVFESKEHYLKYGLGMVVLKNNEIVAGASSYTSYREGIEIEVDTKESERRKHLATAVCSALILECLKCGLYPSWDAQNLWSVHLAEKLGYEFDHEYIAYEVVK